MIKCEWGHDFMLQLTTKSPGKCGKSAECDQKPVSGFLPATHGLNERSVLSWCIVHAHTFKLRQQGPANEEDKR